MSEISRVLLLGSTGLCGQAMERELVRQGHMVTGAARTGAPFSLDITDEAALINVLHDVAPNLIVNCAALVSIDACESDPGLAWRCNARPLGIIADWTKQNPATLLHVSTDHYYVDGADTPHSEEAPVRLVNEYARTKFAGEALALVAPDALVLRTSIVGIRGWAEPSFGEWAIDVASRDRQATLFADAYTSSIDVTAFARASHDLLAGGARGLYNLAAREVYTKEDFVREAARQLGKPLNHAATGSVQVLAAPRASCLGLDVRRAEARLGYRLPTLAEVVASVLKQHAEGCNDLQ